MRVCNRSIERFLPVRLQWYGLPNLILGTPAAAATMNAQTSFCRFGLWPKIQATRFVGVPLTGLLPGCKALRPGDPRFLGRGQEELHLGVVVVSLVCSAWVYSLSSIANLRYITN